MAPPPEIPKGTKVIERKKASGDIEYVVREDPRYAKPDCRSSEQRGILTQREGGFCENKKDRYSGDSPFSWNPVGLSHG
jgi:hypothetical protein